MSNVCLQEWSTAGPTRGSPLAGVTLGTDTAARTLVERLRGKIEVLELAQGLELRATSFVGRFQISGITVTVQPKISGTPLLNLFRYAYGLRHIELFGKAAFASSAWSMQDLLIQQLAAETSELLARGVHREYERREVNLVSPRGRIDFTPYLRSAHRAATTLPCVHHPRSEDTRLNRVLLGGLYLAARMATDSELKVHVRRLARILSLSVSPQPLTSFEMVEAWQTMDRRTTTYRPALTLIELLLGNEGLSLDVPSVRIQANGFLFDMNRFFQTLVSRFLHDHLPDADVHDEFRLKGMFSYAPGHNPRFLSAPTPRPDFVVMRAGQMAAVLDAKYRDLWTQALPRDMLYQLALYALGRPGPDHTATMIYPTIDATAREQTIVIHEPLRGAARAHVTLRALNLLELEQALRAGSDVRAGHRRVALAHSLAFGEPPGM